MRTSAQSSLVECPHHLALAAAVPASTVRGKPTIGCTRCASSAGAIGRYQAPQQNPVQLIATVHGCPEWPEIAGAPYIWWVQPHEQRYECPYCRSAVIVTNAKVKRPVDDPSHTWWAVPQGMTFEAARHYWVARGQHRVYL